MAQAKKILLIDDDVDLREALSELLIMTEHFDVFEGGDGADALEKIKQQSLRFGSSWTLVARY